VRAYATNTDGTIYGEQREFTTRDGIIELTTGPASSITATSATIAGNITTDGGATVTARGVCYSTTQNPTSSDTCVASGSGIGEFSANLTGMSAVSTYFVRAYAINTVMTSYGAQASFVTAALLPKVTTGSVSGLGATTATVSGEVTSDGGATVSARGICYSTTQNPTTANSCMTSGSGTGMFSATLTGLDPGTTYYVRAYGSNIEGTAYGAQASFVSLPVLPSVTTGTVTGITSSGATVAGEVTATGGATVTGRGVCYSATQNPTIAGTCVVSGSGIGTFNSTIAGLTRLTAYYVRSYATNSEGTIYGIQRSFSTLPDLPKVTNFGTSEITPNSAKLDGSVTDTGGATGGETIRGFCWGTMPNIPVDWDVCVGRGSGLGDFAYTVSGLTTGMRYYWAAYATNNAGTAWSAVSNFVPR
jgi:hypothetical protein